MKDKVFKAYVVEQVEDKYMGRIREKPFPNLPKGNLLIKVHYSSLNYKDALSATGNKGVTKKYPHIPGIDAVGTVISSDSQSFHINDKVIVTSYDLGMNTDGGFGEFISVPSQWVLPLPEKLSMVESMIYGTAGLTAGISVLRLSEIVKPHHGKILVSGATGGVGSLSVAILSKLGYSVSAITGKEREGESLLKLGAEEIIRRSDFEKLDKKPLLTSQYAGAIDCVGGVILENILKTLQPAGAVTCCGNVASPKLDISVYPFILRGVSLMGIDSQNYPMIGRKKVWNNLATIWKPATLLENYEEISLNDLNIKIPLMLQGHLKRRCIIKMIH